MIKLALLQLRVSNSKQENLNRAAELVKEATSKGANIVVLPECFNSPYGTQYFKDYAEPISGQTATSLARMAKENSVYIIGGSFPERDADRLYNTCTIWDRNGERIGVHRKVNSLN